MYDALYRDETGAGVQRVNKGSLPAVLSTKSWVTPVDVPPSSRRAFGVISTPLEKKNGGHEGVDIGVGHNAPVKAAASGKIVYRLNSCVEGDRPQRRSPLPLRAGCARRGARLVLCTAEFLEGRERSQGRVYDARLLAFGRGAADPRANAIGKTCRVSAAGDSTAFVRPEASGSAPPYGVILAGQRLEVRGFIGDWTSFEGATLDGTGTHAAGSDVGHAVGLDAFIHVSQLDLSDCTPGTSECTRSAQTAHGLGSDALLR